MISTSDGEQYDSEYHMSATLAGDLPVGKYDPSWPPMLPEENSSYNKFDDPPGESYMLPDQLEEHLQPGDSPSIVERIARAISGGRDLARREFYNQTRAGLFNSDTAPEEGSTTGGLGRGLKERRSSDMYQARSISDAVRGDFERQQKELVESEKETERTLGDQIPFLLHPGQDIVDKDPNDHPPIKDTGIFTNPENLDWDTDAKSILKRESIPDPDYVEHFPRAKQVMMTDPLSEIITGNSGVRGLGGAGGTAANDNALTRNIPNYEGAVKNQAIERGQKSDSIISNTYEGWRNQPDLNPLGISPYGAARQASKGGKTTVVTESPGGVRSIYHDGNKVGRDKLEELDPGYAAWLSKKGK